jgi:hypothetical protein
LVLQHRWCCGYKPFPSSGCRRLLRLPRRATAHQVGTRVPQLINFLTTIHYIRWTNACSVIYKKKNSNFPVV